MSIHKGRCQSLTTAAVMLAGPDSGLGDSCRHRFRCHEPNSTGIRGLTGIYRDCEMLCVFFELRPSYGNNSACIEQSWFCHYSRW